MQIIWLTENYPPQRGGMAQSCDRIITNLRKQGLVIHVIHFTNRKQAFKTETKINGSYTACLKSKDIAHGLNLTLTFLEHNFIDKAECMIAFGGLFPLTAVPIYHQLFEIPYYVCLRGNDFDISLFSFRKKYILDQALHSSKGIMVNSRDKQKCIQKLYPDCNTHFTPNSIDLNEWLPLKSEIQFAETWRQQTVSENSTVMGLFGFLKEKKGVLFFLNSLIKWGKHSTVHLIFSGELEEVTLTLLNENNIAYNVLPFLDRVELIKHYLCCDWVTIPSFYEGMPNVLLEAGGLKIPVLASSIDGMKDVLQESQTGLLFEVLNEDSCIKAICKAVNMNQTERQQLATKLYAHLDINYSLKKESSHYLQIFKNDEFNL